MRTSVGGRPIHARTVNCEEWILHHVKDNDWIRICRIAVMENVEHVTVWLVFYKQ